MRLLAVGLQLRRESSCRKKYLIEQRAGEKIVSRTKGFTVEACAEGVAIAADALQFPPNRPSPAAEEGRCQKVRDRLRLIVACHRLTAEHTRHVRRHEGLRDMCLLRAAACLRR